MTFLKNINISLRGLAEIAMGITIVILLLMLNMCHGKPCPGATIITEIKHDTIYPPDKLQPIVVKVPEAYKVVAVKNVVGKKKSDYSFDELGFEPESSNPVIPPAGGKSVPAICPPCDSIRYYSDSVYEKGNFHLVVNDTIIGKVISRGYQFANLKPSVTTTITKTQLERVKLYVGGSFTLNARNMDRWGAGPSALITIPKIGGITYAYDIKNNIHIAGLYALLRFKKN